MGLETGTYVSDLNTSNPTNGDAVSQGAGHLRLIKSVLQATFPNGDAPIYGLRAETAQTLTGTAINFTSIPAWVKRITVLFSSASTNGGDAPLIQLGDSGGIEATGYLGNSGVMTNGTAGSIVAYTTGFGINGTGSAAKVFHGRLTLELQDASTNTWVADGKFHQSNTTAYVTTGGSKSLSATLDRIRITTEGGTDAYDAGKVNILFE